MYNEDGAEFDLVHPVEPTGTQKHKMEELRMQIATLTPKVKRLQPACARVQISEFYSDKSEFDDWLKASLISIM